MQQRPRGVGRSREVRCTVEGFQLPDDADDATTAALFDDFSERYARGCLDQDGSFVRHVGTMNAARDIDMLRRALGERQITCECNDATQLGIKLLNPL